MSWLDQCGWKKKERMMRDKKTVHRDYVCVTNISIRNLNLKKERSYGEPNGLLLYKEANECTEA